MIEGIVGRHGVPGRNESGERLQELCAKQELVVGKLIQGKGCALIHVYENGGRNGGRQVLDGLCVVTKTNAWKTVRCDSVERRSWRNV